jgi:hypothetical protein
MLIARGCWPCKIPCGRSSARCELTPAARAALAALHDLGVVTVMWGPAGAPGAHFPCLTPDCPGRCAIVDDAWACAVCGEGGHVARLTAQARRLYALRLARQPVVTLDAWRARGEDDPA